jgi:hypothetical protein
MQLKKKTREKMKVERKKNELVGLCQKNPTITR